MIILQGITPEQTWLFFSAFLVLLCVFIIWIMRRLHVSVSDLAGFRTLLADSLAELIKMLEEIKALKQVPPPPVQVTLQLPERTTVQPILPPPPTPPTDPSEHA